tara:strand:+ start:2804 stop:4327 length:1524 start_codon:yes stop_codon:yes gene_type:complete
MGAIFISYRREDSEGHAGRLFEDLVEHFGPGSVFMDVVGIEPGRDFRKVIDAKVADCSVLLAVIGKSWLTLKDDTGGRRIDHPHDFVRLETASALQRDIPVIPVLVHNASMPTQEDLSPDLADLAFRNGVELTHARWDSDVSVLIRALQAYVTPESATTTPTPKPSDKTWLKSLGGVAGLAIALGIGYFSFNAERTEQEPKASREPAEVATEAASEAPGKAVAVAEQEAEAAELARKRKAAATELERQKKEEAIASAEAARKQQAEQQAQEDLRRRKAEEEAARENAARIKANRLAAISTDGMGVRQISLSRVGDLSGNVAGYLKQIDRQTWHETDASSNRAQFTFHEEGRTQQAVFLFDHDRTMRLRIDLKGLQVTNQTLGKDEFSPIYDISAASGQPARRSVSAEEEFAFGTTGFRAVTAAIGGRDGEIRGYFRQTSASTWKETAAGSPDAVFTFELEGRDLWSVYLLDRRREMRIQLDLFHRKVGKAPMGSADFSPLYDIVSAR